MILGIGVGLVETERFDAALARYGERLVARVFTPGERVYAAERRRGRESLAARFAAKCAARRALGLAGAPWQEVEVVRRRGAEPTLRLYGAAATLARERGVRRSTVSLTHDGALCLAQVILEGAA